MKLTPYQEKLARLRAEVGLSEAEIGKLLGKKPQTIRMQFMDIRKILEIPSFEEAYRKYKKRPPTNQHVEPLQLPQNQSDVA